MIEVLKTWIQNDRTLGVVYYLENRNQNKTNEFSSGTIDYPNLFIYNKIVLNNLQFSQNLVMIEAHKICVIVREELLPFALDLIALTPKDIIILYISSK